MRGVGIIGSGTIAAFHARAIEAIEDARLIGIWGTNEIKTAELADLFTCIAFESMEALLEHRDISVVTVATPSGTHLEPCLAAARAGKHVLCEKPLEISVARIRQMIQVCHDQRVVLSGIFNRRFNDVVDALKRAVEQDRFGRITSCSAYIKWFRDQDYYDNGAWRGTRALDGGGALMNQSIHTIDLLQYLAGPIARLSGTMACLTHDNIEVEDSAVAILEFENGALGVIEASTSIWSAAGHPAEIQICGEHGSVFMKDDYFELWDFQETRPEDESIRSKLMTPANQGLGARDAKAINVDGHIRNFADAFEAIDKGRVPRISGHEAIKAVAIIEAIYSSAAAGGQWTTIQND